MNRRKSSGSKPQPKNLDQGILIDSPEPQRIPQERRIMERREAYQGPVPPPDILERFELLVPGTAKKMFDQAEQESLHRRKIEERTNDANIAAQQKAIDIERGKMQAIARSDLVGQIFGLLVTSACIGGAVWCGIQGHEKVAIALTVVPSAAVIQAFFAKRSNSKQPKDQ